MPEIPLGIWRHCKGGYYEVIVVAAHAGTAEPFVVYRSVDNPRCVWARTAEEFLECVDYSIGVEHDAVVKVPRFFYVRSADNPALNA